MSRVIYFKFLSNTEIHSIPFDGYSLSADLFKTFIKTKFNIKSNTHDVEIYNNIGKMIIGDYQITAFETIIGKLVPTHANNRNKKTNHVENFKKSDPYSTNLEISNNFIKTEDIKNMTEDQVLDSLCDSSQYENVIKIKRPAIGTKPPNDYICNKCRMPGHWIQYCPGIKDKYGNYLDARAVKRPSGIPTSTLKEVAENTPNAYLTNDGRYVVNPKNYEAMIIGKKEKRPFSLEENPPLIEAEKEKLPPLILCSLCNNIFNNPYKTPCCKSVYCENCILTRLYDPNFGNKKCPNCTELIDQKSQLSCDLGIMQIVNKWYNKTISFDEVENILSKPKYEETEEQPQDLFDCVFFLNKENSKDDISKPVTTKLPRIDVKNEVKTESQSYNDDKAKKLVEALTKVLPSDIKVDLNDPKLMTIAKEIVKSAENDIFKINGIENQSNNHQANQYNKTYSDVKEQPEPNNIRYDMEYSKPGYKRTHDNNYRQRSRSREYEKNYSVTYGFERSHNSYDRKNLAYDNRDQRSHRYDRSDRDSYEYNKNYRESRISEHERNNYSNGYCRKYGEDKYIEKTSRDYEDNNKRYSKYEDSRRQEHAVDRRSFKLEDKKRYDDTYDRRSSKYEDRRHYEDLEDRRSRKQEYRRHEISDDLRVNKYDDTMYLEKRRINKFEDLDDRKYSKFVEHDKILTKSLKDEEMQLKSERTSVSLNSRKGESKDDIDNRRSRKQKDDKYREHDKSHKYDEIHLKSERTSVSLKDDIDNRKSNKYRDDKYKENENLTKSHKDEENNFVAARNPDSLNSNRDETTEDVIKNKIKKIKKSKKHKKSKYDSKKKSKKHKRDK